MAMVLLSVITSDFGGHPSIAVVELDSERFLLDDALSNCAIPSEQLDSDSSLLICQNHPTVLVYLKDIYLIVTGYEETHAISNIEAWLRRVVVGVGAALSLPLIVEGQSCGLISEAVSDKNVVDALVLRGAN